MLIVNFEFDLQPATLFLAINILDRCLSKKGIIQKRNYELQLLAAWWIAAKYRGTEDHAVEPLLQDLIDLRNDLKLGPTCEHCWKLEFVEAEQNVLKAIDWRVEHSDACTFIEMAFEDRADATELQHLSIYIAAISLFFSEFVDELPSVVANAARSLACTILDWPRCDKLWPRSYEKRIFRRLVHRIQSPPQSVSAIFRHESFSRVAVRCYANRHQLLPQHLDLVKLTRTRFAEKPCCRTQTYDNVYRRDRLDLWRV